MNYSNLSLKHVIQAFLVLMLFSLPLSVTYAKAGCCANHGGVASCNTKTGHQMCKDNTDSPTCMCDGKTAPAVKQSPKPAKAVAPAPVPAKAAAPATVPAKKVAPAPVPAKATAKPASTAGCCSGHGGVKKCDKKTGFQMCKDNTMSSTCKCN